MVYDRSAAINYAHMWALARNPAFYNFDNIGGDCTNFISQCLYAGSGRMNFTRDTGWYYRSANDRAAAWTDVEYLHRFLVGNKGVGPWASELALEYAQPGDVIQLSFDGYKHTHSLLILYTYPEILIAAHSDDALNRQLASYQYHSARLLHIEGVR